MALTHVSQEDFDVALKKAEETIIFHTRPTYFKYSEATYNGYTYSSKPYEWITQLYTRYAGVDLTAVYKSEDGQMIEVHTIAENPDVLDRFVAYSEVQSDKLYVLPFSEFLAYSQDGASQELRFERV